MNDPLGIALVSCFVLMSAIDGAASWHSLVVGSMSPDSPTDPWLDGSMDQRRSRP